MGNPFWSVNTAEPLRKYKFQVTFQGNVIWYAKSVTKPSAEVSVTEYQIANHKIKYPGIVTWNDIDIVIIDTVEEGRGKSYYGDLLNYGYHFSGAGKEGIKKRQSSSVLIEQLDSSGRIHETWTLINPFIKSVKFGDLDYSSDDFIEITLTVAYDSATLT